MSRGGSLRARVGMGARMLRIGRSERRDSVKVLRPLEKANCKGMERRVGQRIRIGIALD